jgi:hypothetical protein
LAAISQQAIPLEALNADPSPSSTALMDGDVLQTAKRYADVLDEGRQVLSMVLAAAYFGHTEHIKTRAFSGCFVLGRLQSAC